MKNRDAKLCCGAFIVMMLLSLIYLGPSGAVAAPLPVATRGRRAQDRLPISTRISFQTGLPNSEVFQGRRDC